MFSSRNDPRCLENQPLVFPDIVVAYNGTSVQLPPNLPDAMITVTANIPGFSSNFAETYLLVGGELNLVEKIVTLNPNLEVDEWRVVLTWNKEPRDLDLYCRYMFRSKQHTNQVGTVYWNAPNKDGLHDIDKGNIELDRDEQQGTGPETITFIPKPERKYCFYVHNFVWSTDEKPGVPLTNSGARVVIHKGDGDDVDFEIPTEIVVDRRTKGVAKFRHVFDLVNGTIVPYNVVVTENLAEKNVSNKYIGIYI